MGGDGVVTGKYTGNRHYTGNVSFAQGAAGVGFNFIKKDTQIWYVDSGKSPSVTGDGLTWAEAFLTLQEAVTKAGDYDTILVAPGAIETIADAGITISQEGLKIFGGSASEATQNASLKITGGTEPMFTILGDRFEIAGFNLSQRTAYPCINIGASTGAVYQTHIHHCNLDGGDPSSGTYGVRPDGTVDPVNLVVEDCYFKNFATASIYANGTRDTYRRNTIMVYVDTTGIDIIPTGAGRHSTIVVDNLLFGKSGSSTIGIKLAGNIDAGSGIIAGNLLSGTFNTTITAGSGDICVQNFFGGTTGGSVIDANNSA